jgi:hypothetical protein
MPVSEKNRLRKVLSSVLDTEVTVGARGDQAWPVTVGATTPSTRFEAIWVRRGWPADVQAAIDRVPGATLVVAPAFSPGARSLLNSRGLSWADDTGGARIAAPGLIVRLDGEPIQEPKPQNGLVESRRPASRRGRPRTRPCAPLDGLAGRARQVLGSASERDPAAMGRAGLDEQARAKPRARRVPRCRST